MIYISTSCIKKSKIADAVLELIKNGFQNIELSGGTKYYDGWLEELMDLKGKYNLNYLVHNYFPPPKDAFVFNLASLDNEIASKSIQHAKKAIDTASILEAKKVGFHAGFLINIPVNQIGKKIKAQDLYNKELSLKTFIENYHEILLYCTKKNIKLYLENNVLSKENLKNFKTNPFFLVKSQEISFFKNHLKSFNYIFDYAHSYVSSTSLKLNESIEFDNFINQTDYLHISDNDGYSDLNNSIKKGSPIYKHLCENPPIDKTVTLEIYEDISQIKKTYNWLINLKQS
ncbi:MAG: hypothetical protein CL853_04875 [Crocinitomicaceae bacterium]|nr:hypothetical protein [Crocinitomicaceae bacterium]|tara:strand:+ start:251 stop:1111 length:861 start_codon:yes stop_codon:yes gene_type:complete